MPMLNILLVDTRHVDTHELIPIVACRSGGVASGTAGSRPS
jgi:hypothetical protein